jgi:Flp pilus assembly pilin Flp
MKALIRNLVVREEGQDLVEYALLAALLSIVSITALLALGPTIANVWTQIFRVPDLSVGIAGGAKAPPAPDGLGSEVEGR